MTINPEKLYKIFEEQGISFFTGVPDSTIKDFCFYLDDHASKQNHIIAANEGNSIAIAAGYHLSTGKIPLVYMQNSGLGNAVNPLTSLVDKEVFAIPMIILVGWRGEPGTEDAIQHEKDGHTQIKFLESLDIPFSVLSLDYSELKTQLQSAIEVSKSLSTPYVILVRRNTFEHYKSVHNMSSPVGLMSREDAISKIINLIDKDDVVVSTTGKASRELCELRKKRGHNNNSDFFVIGSMGHASSISLGISLQKPDRNIFCLDGDGALVMHMGSLSTIGKYSYNNFKHILINNYSHDSVGGQQSSSDIIDFSLLSKAVSYKNYFKIENEYDFVNIFNNFQESLGPSFLEIIVKKGSRKDLGRPELSPIQNKTRFMDFLEL